MEDPYSKKIITLYQIFKDFPSFLIENKKYLDEHEEANHPILPRIDRIRRCEYSEESISMVCTSEVENSEVMKNLVLQPLKEILTSGFRTFTYMLDKNEVKPKDAWEEITQRLNTGKLASN